MLAGLFYRQNGVSAHRSEVLTENRYARFSDSKESNCSGGSSLSSPNCNTQGRYGMRGSPAFPRKCGTGELRETSLLCDHDEPALPASRKFSGAVSCSTFSSNEMGYLLEKLKAALKGCSVRRRMKTPTYQLLKGRIKKTSCGNSSGVNDRYTISQRKHNVSQLISFLEGNLEALVVSKDTDVDVEKPVAGRCENANGGSDKCTQFHESSKIHPGVHLSNEAKVNTDFIRFSLMETIGDSNFSLESMSNKLDASFLDMRRRDFLQKIFIIETRGPPGTKSSNGIGLHNFCPLGFSQALTSHGVGYRRIIQHLERIAGPYEKAADFSFYEGKSIVKLALASDTGRLAFDECNIVRQQLETLVQSVGYDANVFAFGGLVVMGLLEVGGDADFVGVADVEPGALEAGEIVSRLSREMRRLGLKSASLPRARVPVIKVDRVSKSLPGTSLHHLSTCGLFQFTRQLNDAECSSFKSRMKENHGAINVEWNSNQQFSTVEFKSTSELVAALTEVKRHEGIDIPLRLPVDPRNGPEIYRLPFDFCFSSVGLRNSYLLSEALSKYVFSRHLLLLVKKWGRSSGVINSIDGLLASYAFTVMCTHFLIKVGVIPKISALRSTDEPQLLPFFPEYRSLHNGEGCNMAELGFLTAAFFEYYGSIFDYEKSVVCTTNVSLLKKTMRWEKSPGMETGKPPFFEFAIKDPYGLDNIGRNLDIEAAVYVKSAHSEALKTLLQEYADPEFAVNIITQSPPKPIRRNRTLASRGISSATCSPDQLEARHILKKVAFHERRRAMERFGERTARHTEEQRVVSSVAKDVLGWIKCDKTQ